jgi:hypothetical protein
MYTTSKAASQEEFLSHWKNFWGEAWAAWLAEDSAG